MSSTTFSGPVTSTNGFVGDLTGNVTGNITGGVTGNVTTSLIESATGVDAITIANATGNATFVNTTSMATVTVSAGITMADSANITTNATTGTIIASNATQKLGFYGAAPVVQYATEGTLTGFTAGGGTTVTDKSTFTGNTGTKAYTIGDVVLALKRSGLVAS